MSRGKHIQCKLRTAEAIHDWLRFVASVEHLASASKFRVNGKAKNSDGFYSALQCVVESENIIDFLTEYLAFIEKRDSLSFDISVKDGETDSQPELRGKADNEGGSGESPFAEGDQ